MARAGMREQKITLGEMRASGPRRPLVYCADYRCAHSLVIDALRWPDDVRPSDLEPKFTCQACGHRGADIRALFAVDRPSSGYPLTVEAPRGRDQKIFQVEEPSPCLTLFFAVGFDGGSPGIKGHAPNALTVRGDYPRGSRR